MKTAPAQKYRDSEKRKITKEQNRAAIQKAAWEVFCTIGMDAANIRDTVNRSGLSPAPFTIATERRKLFAKSCRRSYSTGSRRRPARRVPKRRTSKKLLFRCYDS